MPLPDGRGDMKTIACPYFTLIVFNEWHSANTSKKIRAVVESGAKSGKYRTTFASYGYYQGR